MSARRCAVHGSFPTDNKFVDCPICGESTSWISNDEPADDWQDKVARVKEMEQVEAAEPPDIPVVTSDVKVKHENGVLWIHVWDLYAHGMRDRLRTFDLIQVGKQVFEVIEYVRDRREYLVRPFSLELSDYDLRRLADGLA